MIPQALVDAEVAHRGLTELHVVPGMHERKHAFTDLADGFVTIPGGTGTMDELWEALSWAQLGYHADPVGLLNVAGYYDHLIAFWEKMGEVGFLRAQHRDLLIVADTLDGAARPDGARTCRRSRSCGCAHVGPCRGRASASERGTDPRDGDRRDARTNRSRAGRRASPPPACCSTARRASGRGCSMPGAGACDDIVDGQDHGHGMTRVADAPARRRRGARR